MLLEGDDYRGPWGGFGWHIPASLMDWAADLYCEEIAVMSDRHFICAAAVNALHRTLIADWERETEVVEPFALEQAA